MSKQSPKVCVELQRIFCVQKVQQYTDISTVNAELYTNDPDEEAPQERSEHEIEMQELSPVKQKDSRADAEGQLDAVVPGGSDTGGHSRTGSTNITSGASQLYLTESSKKKKSGSRWRRRWAKTPKRLVLFSFVLFAGGVTLLTIGLWCLGECDLGRAIGMIIVGGLMFLPGGYSMYILINYWRGVHGFHHNQLPQFD